MRSVQAGELSGKRGLSQVVGRRMRWLCVMSLALAGAVAAGGCAGPGESSVAAPSKAVRVVSVDMVNDRTRDVLIDSPSVGNARVRLLLPIGFDADPHRCFTPLTRHICSARPPRSAESSTP
jgi:hypothetical protein